MSVDVSPPMFSLLWPIPNKLLWTCYQSWNLNPTVSPYKAGTCAYFGWLIIHVKSRISLLVLAAASSSILAALSFASRISSAISSLTCPIQSDRWDKTSCGKSRDDVSSWLRFEWISMMLTTLIKYQTCMFGIVFERLCFSGINKTDDLQCLPSWWWYTPEN